MPIVSRKMNGPQKCHQQLNITHHHLFYIPEKIILNCWRKSFQKMPVSASLSERLSFLEKKMTDNDNKPYDEELYNMMKVSNVK